MPIPPRLLPLAVAALCGTGCMSTPIDEAALIEARIADQALEMAAQQVRRCYRTPRVSFAGRQIVTRLRVRVSAEGQIGGLPEIVFQSGVTRESQAHAGRMAEAAIQAVMRCAPLRLPDGFFREGWTEFELTFSPLARG